MKKIKFKHPIVFDVFSAKFNFYGVIIFWLTASKDDTKLRINFSLFCVSTLLFSEISLIALTIRGAVNISVPQIGDIIAVS